MAGFYAARISTTPTLQWMVLSPPYTISSQGAARDRVLPCVRPLMRRVTCRGPVWECESRDHITTARSKRSPCAWFSQLRLTDVAPYLSVDLLTPSDSLASASPKR